MTAPAIACEAYALAFNAKVASEALEMLLIRGAGKEHIEKLAALITDQIDRALDVLQPLVDGEVAA